MSDTSSEETTEPPTAPTLVAEAMSALGLEAIDEPTLEIIRAARAQLVEVEMMLRDLWYDKVDSGPALSARVNVAARFAHNAADALSPQTLL